MKPGLLRNKGQIEFFFQLRKKTFVKWKETFDSIITKICLKKFEWNLTLI